MAWATNRVNAWMENAVVIDHTGKVLEGFYDGYGRLDGYGRVDAESIHNPGNLFRDEPAGPEPSVWHRRRWENAGSPKEYVPSDSAPDQGYFFSPGAHDMKLPKKKPGPH